MTLQQRAEAEVELFSYAQRLGREKRERPADDVWTILAHAETDAPDGSRTRLSELELDLFFLILSVAGSETTRNAISQGVMALLEHPEQLEELRRDPSLMATAADEMIRWASPVLYFGRTATRDVELGSRQIREGDRVVLWYASANRDEAAFEDPFRFDVRRDPNHHVAFGGGGPHYCLGASLARKEVQVMVGELVRRFRTIEPAGDPVWSLVGPTVNVGVSLERFPVRVSVA